MEENLTAGAAGEVIASRELAAKPREQQQRSQLHSERVSTIPKNFCDKRILFFHVIHLTL